MKSFLAWVGAFAIFLAAILLVLAAVNHISIPTDCPVKKGIIL